MDRYLFSEEQRSLLEGMQVPFAIYRFINKRVVTVLLSDGFCRMFGYDDMAQAYYDMDNDMYKDTHPDDVARIANAALKFATEGGKYEVVYRTRIKGSHKYKVVHAMGKHIMTDNGVRLAHVWYLDEGTYTEEPSINETELNKALNDALHRESIVNSNQYDYLTGLPRMTYFFELANAGKAQMQKDGEHCAVLFIDLSGMKFFNSNNGFAEGDKLLKAFARALVGVFSLENCCHIGSDHFAVYTQEEGLEERLKALFEECKHINNGNSLPVRVGIYQNYLEAVPISTAVDRAKCACDELRNSYRSQFNYFKFEMRDKEYLKQYVITNLDRALREEWIHVYYQPIVRALNGRTCNEEALARWIDPSRGMLSPAEFIPTLESAGILYKLDLYVLEQVLEKIKRLKENGVPVVPQSINLSRSDFDCCDMVEEIRKRVDDALISRSLITIEITESVIGSNFEYMREQILRFKDLGFPVWMDVFGSGYSSLDVLQDIPFDLIKFDMSFMQKLNTGVKGKIILTELMKMATALGVDTVCEGIETKDQVSFLQDIGCSKLQGYYYHRPAPIEDILGNFKTDTSNEYESLEESDYYESIGSVNLYDLAFATGEAENISKNFFSTIPMGILEITGDTVRFVRTNPSYREFMKRFYNFDTSNANISLPIELLGHGSVFMKQIQQCCNGKERIFFNEEISSGTIVHSFIRRISTNPSSGTVAIAVTVLSISEASDGATYASIARALASDYYNIYYVDLKTDRFIEYTSAAGSEELAIERRGKNFFEASHRDAKKRIFEDDREQFLKSFTKENILKEINEHGAFNITYRLTDTGKPMYANLKVTKIPDGNHIIIGISIIDSYMKQKAHYEKLQQEQDTMVRVMALSEGYLSLFTIDPDSGHYTEYSSTDDFGSLGAAKEGDDFFRQAIIDSSKYFYPEDVPHFHEKFSKEKIMAQIEKCGSFKISYRLMIGGQCRPVSLIIAPFKDREGQRLVAGIRQEQ